MSFSDRYNEVSYFLRTRLPPATRALVISNVAVFLLYWIVAAIMGPGPRNPFHYLACDPVMVRRGWVWQLLTYAWLHAGPMHLLGNMMFLWFLGSLAEQRIGTASFWRVYLTAAGAAGLLHALIYLRAPFAPDMIGASGAVMAVAVICACYYFDLPVYLILWPFPVKLGYLILVLLAVDALYLIGPSSGGVANHAHLIGAAIGYAWVKAGGPLPRARRSRSSALWLWTDVLRFHARAIGRRLWPFGRRSPRRAAIRRGKVHRSIWDDDYFRK